jgi:hypothetical protein
VNGRQLKKLATVAKSIGDSNSAVGCDKLYLQEDGTFFVTDLDTQLVIRPSADTIADSEHTHSLALDLKSLKSFANKVSVKDSVGISADSNGITLSKGKVTKRWNDSVEKDSAPADIAYGFTPGGAIFVDEADEVRNVLSRLDKMVSRDDYRPALNGYYLDLANNNWVATTGAVMGIIPTCGVNGEVGKDKPAVIINPDVRKVLDKIKPEGNISFYYGPEGRSGGNIVHHLIITCTDSEGWEYSLTTLLIDGPYPPYQKVIPDANKYRAEFILPLQAMNNLARFMPDGSSQSKMCRFCFDNPRFESTNYEGPVTTVQVDTEIEEIGEGLEEDETVGFNPQLLGKAVGNFFENNPLFHYIDKTMPAVLTDDTDESLALIMPVKLPGE